MKDYRIKFSYVHEGSTHKGSLTVKSDHPLTIRECKNLVVVKNIKKIITHIKIPNVHEVKV